MTYYHPLHLLPLPPQIRDPKPYPTAITVDPYTDLLWLGQSSGLTTALYSPLTLTRNVQFPSHPIPSLNTLYPIASPVKEIKVTDREIWTLTESGICGRKRGGMAKWSVGDVGRGLMSMCGNPVNSHEVLGAGVGGLVVANTSRGEVVRRVDSAGSIVKIAPSSRTVFAASLSGQISILDPRMGFKSANKVVPVQAHTGGLSGADIQGNIVCTWGWTHMSGHPLPDPLVRLYDIRTLRPLAPISFPSGPTFCLLHPTSPSNLLIASQQGILQSIDLSSSTPGNYQQLDVTSYVTCMALSPSGEYLAFGDADGGLHLWCDKEVGEGREGDLGRFNGYEGIKPEWVDESEALPNIAWDEKTPLNVIGMPYYNEPLLSNIPTSDYAPVTSPFFNPPDPVPQTVLNNMKVLDFVGYAALPKELRGKRYVRKAGPGVGKRATGGNGKAGGLGSRRESAPRFRSEKDRKGRGSMVVDVEEETPEGEVPKSYRKVEIKYSKFGIEDFDFEFYNNTDYSGLETDILNSYTNALLQALHYITPLRAVAKAHICVDCRKEHCLLCETGFLFRMLEDAKGINCQASNFSRAFSATPQASALGLIDSGEKSTSAYGSLIQNFNRWLLSTFSAESVVEGESFNLSKSGMADLKLEDTPSAIDQVLGVDTRTTLTCQACDFVSSRDATIHVVDLTYPKKLSETPSFDELLYSSLLRETSTRATCPNCKQFAPLQSNRLLTSKGLPPVVSINAMVASGEVFDVWRDRKSAGKAVRYLPKSVAMAVDGEGNLKVGNNGIHYEVRSLVVQVQDGPQSPAHLVSFAKIPATEEDEAHWVMFNDFLVRVVSEDEVFRFPDQWKVPAVIILERADSASVMELAKLPVQLDSAALFKDVSVAWNRRKNMIKHKVLQAEELPKPGTFISIDAEFVALQQEEMEFRSDGTKNILRPSHMSLARVSVLRGEGPGEGTPFIDDYIHTSEAVVDYLTEFSGIKNGDLDPNNSPHTLVPLKVAYKKLRLLVDLGCIFIGHGLSKDFRTINIFVPPEQVMDTVTLYSVPGRQRKLSLRFLTWFLLKKDIQTHTHDSIEDAKYALLLYKLWLKYEEEGRMEEVMEEIFDEGHRIGFKPPQDRPPSPVPVVIPPPKQKGQGGGRGQWGPTNQNQSRRHR